MNEPVRRFPELDLLLADLCDGSLDDAKARRLDAMLENDVEAVRHYVEFIDLFCSLTREQAVWAADGDDECGTMKVELQAGSDDDASSTDHSSFISQHSSPSLLPPVIVQSLPSPLSPLSSFIGSAMFSYLVAAVIVSVGLMAAAAWKLSDPAEFADQRTPAIDRGRQSPDPTPRPKLDVVGRITGMIDCRWSDPTTEAVNGAYVSLGRRYALSSGLMEITYDTGAKVLLQGPATYAIESATGAYLSVGKLTAKLEKKVASGQWPVVSDRNASGHQSLAASHSSNPQSLIPNPSFVVRTPTAVVTDLGTEFGVEVDGQGFTTSHVFRGSVRLETIGGDGTRATTRVLHANESAQVKTISGNGKPTVESVAVAAATFIRPGQLVQVVTETKQKRFRQWQAYSEELRRDKSLLAYYDFQQQKDSSSVLRNVAAGGDRSLDGVIQNAAWSNGRMPGKQALRFGGQDDFVQINLPMQIDDVTLAAWVFVESFDHGLSGLVMSDRFFKDGQLHWQIVPDGRLGFDLFESAKGLDSHYFTEPVLNIDYRYRWTHLAVVYDHRRGVTFYVDCKAANERKIGKHVPICIGKARIGHWSPNTPGEPALRCFHGRIDELAVLGRTLTPVEIQRMYEAGRPEGVEKVGVPADQK